MKSIFEIGKVMALYGQVDFCYAMLEQIKDDLSKSRSGIEQAIDNVTGYGQDKEKENIKPAIDYI